MLRLFTIATLGVAIGASNFVYAQEVYAQQVYAQDKHNHHSSSAVSSTTEDSFDAQMTRAMERMHQDMMAAPSGDPDRDFATMMIPHHQGAIDMARIQLQYGKNPALRRLAEGIIVEQLQEIDVMKRALTTLPAAPATSDTHSSHDQKGSSK